MDRALADSFWLTERLAEVNDGHPRRATDWARLALERAGVYIRWATAPDPAAARALERAVLTALADAALWNRAR